MSDGMGQSVRGGMWSDRCARPVAGQKTTHCARNLVAGVSAIYPLIAYLVLYRIALGTDE